ncbi:hypothetical protein BDQ12DRAFT_677505 [Crucibulum laeve]|uniref:Uncharacterized protein n=1 Tax=Crucibulum laeve TaxID=68775 RepID=A0A5C3M9Q9_9AGAR|nr:hypothetical protein BDQ12DRAFT_677505 [Crucibulum laeve]
MPRPSPLSNLSSARPDPLEYQSLTPRTPHSRAGRAEEGFTEIELAELRETEDDDLDHYHQSEGQQQSAPLLASSSSALFAHQKKVDGKKGKGIPSASDVITTSLSRLPLVFGIFIAGVLLILIVLSFERPDVLHRYVGAQIPKPQVPSTSQTQADDDLIIVPSPEPTSKPTAPPPAPADPNTISYANYTTFPLHPSEYQQECGKLMSGYMSHGGYWEAHEIVMDVVHHDDHHDYHLPEGEKTEVCKSTITYMLSGDVGLAADLALMAQAAALARERNRTFLVDDTYWNRGRWMDHFQDIRAREPGPEPGCRAPPPEELVACPRNARHWVISSRTAKFHFGHAFSDNYEDAYAHNLNRLKPIYKAAAESFSSTIRPNADTAALIRLARGELKDLVGPDSPYIAVHIRQGDRKPSSFEFHGKFVPIENFAQAASDAAARLAEDPDVQVDPVVFLASDSPAVRDEFSEFSPSFTVSLAQSQDERLRVLASPEEYHQKDFNELDKETRVIATRGMIVDFALISGMWAWEGDITPDAVVCTISSNICRLAAVGLGWDRAFGNVDEMGAIDNEHKRWIDVDQKGAIVPVWQPFELF